MSFTGEIKGEISYNELKPCCKIAELSALIQLTASLVIKNGTMELEVRSENPTTAKRIMALLKDHFAVKTELSKAKKANLRKNNIYIIKVLSDAKAILEELGLYSETKGLLDYPMAFVINKDCCARAYLAGAFLAFGSCNSPNKPNYHLEISLSSLEHARFVIKLLKRFNIEAKITQRRGKSVVYIKKAETISDFLRCIGAHESLLNFENVRISRDFKNSLTRLDNCEIANEVKSLNAAKKQIENMELIFKNGKYDSLNPKLKAIIELRMKYQDASLSELCEIYYKVNGEKISKSGLKHRLNKIDEIAVELKDE